MKPARQVACDVLVRVEGGAFSHVVLPQALRAASLTSSERAFTTDLVYGTLRSTQRLDHLLAPLGSRALHTLDPGVRAALRLGAYQLVAGVAPHAAVGETVAVVPRRARGYVNAVLRALAAPGRPDVDPACEPLSLWYPEWLVSRLEQDLGAEAAHGALRASNDPGALALRINPAHADVAAVEAELRDAGIAVTRGELSPSALVVRGTGDPSVLPAIAEGRATPQDQSSQAVVDYLAPSPGERVLDVAAAPGGKATAAAERVGRGMVVALDVHPGRLGLVRIATARLALGNLVSVVANGRRLPVPPGAFDRVLVDAPCSGLGVLRRRPETRWRAREEELPRLADLQTALVLEAAHAVREGGVLVYSVCTLTACETKDVAARVVHALGDEFEVLARPPSPWRACGPGAIVLPQDAASDGMFVLGLRRVAGSG